MTTTMTCPMCKNEITVVTAYLERRAEAHESVYCPICHWKLIKNEKEADDAKPARD